MPKMQIEKSIDIDASVDKVFKTLNDYNNWQAWSPWLIMEPGAKVNVEEGGKSYSWDGDTIGSGQMVITNEESNKRLDMDLTFLKPFKSRAKVWFTFSGDEQRTHLTWYMDSSMPFFLFFMTKTMTAAVGMDYDRGLAMLKEKIETDHVLSKLDFEGESSFPGFKYIGRTTQTTQSKIGPDMQEDLKKLSEWADQNKELIGGVPFSQYHKFDIVKGNVEYTSGIPLKDAPSEVPPGFKVGEIPSTSVYTVKHTGKYNHLGNAWSAGQMLMRNKVFKASKKIHPFEVYPNSPMDTKEEDLITEIHFPVK